MGYRYQVSGTKKSGKQGSRMFYCREDAIAFKESCGWDDAEVMRVVQEDDNLASRGVDAAARYLEHMDYIIVERDYANSFGSFDIIAEDADGTLVFCNVFTGDGIDKGFPSERITADRRSAMEMVAAGFLSEYDKTGVPLRFDSISLMVLGTDRAMMKHHVNVLGFGD